VHSATTKAVSPRPQPRHRIEGALGPISRCDGMPWAALAPAPIAGPRWRWLPDPRRRECIVASGRGRSFEWDRAVAREAVESIGGRRW